MLTRKDLIEQVAKSEGVQISVSKTTAVVEKFFQLLKENLMIGETIKIKDFGVFSVAERKSRRSMNIHTKENIIFPAYKTPVFKPYPALKKAVRENV